MNSLEEKVGSPEQEKWRLSEPELNENLGLLININDDSGRILGALYVSGDMWKLNEMVRGPSLLISEEAVTLANEKYPDPVEVRKGLIARDREAKFEEIRSRGVVTMPTGVVS